MQAFETILCPIDFSEHSKEALTFALSSQLANTANVKLVYVLPQINYYDLTFTGSIVLSPGVEEVLAKEKESAEEGCKALKASLEAEHPNKTFAYEILEYGEPGPSIVKAAEAHHAHLIVLGSHGRKGFDRLLMGSVAEYVLRHAKCPVLVFKK
ncbi:MAG: universal stress protein [Bacteroidetes bacterium]|nr:MAG: universal stress protein [Bacteroidota bacterium]